MSLSIYLLTTSYTDESLSVGKYVRTHELDYVGVRVTGMKHTGFGSVINYRCHSVYMTRWLLQAYSVEEYHIYRKQTSMKVYFIAECRSFSMLAGVWRLVQSA